MRPWVGQREASESRVSDLEEKDPGPGRQRANGCSRRAPGTVGAGGGIGEVVTISWLVVTISWLGVDCKHGVRELKTSE